MFKLCPAIILRRVLVRPLRHEEGSNGRAPRAPAAGRVAAEGVPSADAGQGPLLCCRPPPRAQVGRTASFRFCATQAADTTSTGAADATNAATVTATAAAARICASSSALLPSNSHTTTFRIDFWIEVVLSERLPGRGLLRRQVEHRHVRKRAGQCAPKKCKGPVRCQRRRLSPCRDDGSAVCKLFIECRVRVL